MQSKPDDFKARALDLLSVPRMTAILSFREQRVLWDIAFGSRQFTAADANELKFIGEKLQPSEAVA